MCNESCNETATKLHNCERDCQLRPNNARRVGRGKMVGTQSTTSRWDVETSCNETEARRSDGPEATANVPFPADLIDSISFRLGLITSIRGMTSHYCEISRAPSVVNVFVLTL